jgi:hypothetical protein
MNERFIVRCKSAVGCALAGIYASSLTPTGMVATWKRERAARHESEATAARMARELSRKYSGSVWGIEPDGAAQ